MPMLPADLIASLPTVPVDPAPVLPSAPSLVAHALALPDVASLTTLPSLPPVLSRPKGPQPAPATSTPLISATPMPIRSSSVPSSQPLARSSSNLASQSPQVRKASPPLPPVPSQPSPVLPQSPSVSPPSIRSIVSLRSPPGLPPTLATARMPLSLCLKSLVSALPSLSSLPVQDRSNLVSPPPAQVCSSSVSSSPPSFTLPSSTLPLSSSSSPSTTPRIYELSPLPPPSPIAAASPDPSEDTEAIQNSH